MSYIITAWPSTYIHEKVTIERSKDGVIYEVFDEALAECLRIDGAGVTELFEEDNSEK